MRTAVPAEALDEEETVAAAIAQPAPPNISPAYVIPATFASAGLGNAISACCTNPFDVVKVRQQLLLQRSGLGSGAVKPTFITLGLEMARSEGVKSLYSGVTASCLRELSYSTIRMGGYEPAKEFVSSLGVSPTSFLNKVLAGVLSGAIGAAVATPTDLVKVRMQAPRPSGRAPYRNTFVAFREVYREGAHSKAPGATSGVAGGVKSLWRGVGPTIFRAAVLTSSQIATYDQVKNGIKAGSFGFHMNEGITLHFLSSAISGFACSAASQPIDVIKTRVMVDKTGASGGSFAVVSKLLVNEGPLAFYKGFSACWGRLGLHTTISLVLFEQFRALFGIKPL